MMPKMRHFHCFPERPSLLPTLLALDSALASEVRELLPGRVLEHHGADLIGVPPSEWADEGPAQLVGLCEREGVNVLVLGVRLGGQRYRALNAAAVLLAGAERQEKPPAVVVVTPSLPVALHKHIWDLGCYDAVVINRVRRGGLAQAVADRVVAASAWRRGRAVARALVPPQASDELVQRPARQPRRRS